jgi:DNA-binding beta-propeller fold protein YncE
MFDAATRKLLQFSPLPRCWNGIAFSRDGRHLFVSGGNSRRLYRYDVAANGKLGEPTMARLGQGEEEEPTTFLAGISVHPRTGKLYVCNEAVNEIWVGRPELAEAWRTRSAPVRTRTRASSARIRASSISVTGAAAA